MAKVLIIDDEPSIGWGLRRLCEGMGHEAQAHPSAEAGLRAAKSWRPDAIFLDVRLPGIDGLTALGEFRAIYDGASVVVVTAFGDTGTAVRAIQGGAFEYLVKPFGLAEARGVLERALNQPTAAARTTPAAALPSDGLVGNSEPMRRLYKRIALAASSGASVLVTGESGVGKELVARAIHRHSDRKLGPFVAVNVAALSATLAESELFGHVEGAFTGATRGRRGLLAEADGGTLFLDEVADIPLDLQVKLLRALEEGEMLPVGSNRPVTTSFRVVGATHQRLLEGVAKGTFRHDLYYRLCAFEIEVPALRDRLDDLPDLAAYFANQFGAGALTFSAAAIEELRRRPWRGNIRELRNAVEHAAVLARAGVVYPEHLPPASPVVTPPIGTDRSSAAERLAEAALTRADELLASPEGEGTAYQRLVGEVEGPLLELAMQRFGHECAPAARALGLHRTTLKRKLDEHGIA